jgi:serine/threonine-protein kinase RsbT
VSSGAGVELRVRVHHDSDVAIARMRVLDVASQQGLVEPAAVALATAATEIARNLIAHARGGEIVIVAAAQAGRRGVIVTALDDGPGIADIDRAMQDGFSTTGSLGLGLPGARRLVDEFEIESAVGVGTRVTLRKWGAR